ncbi:MAG: CDGSH iron-sulfur domain-containing protein [Candidatus Diapherotrites archaeon]|nr:CDGSH iron-sulfur domain-containing protein [Candidatus Diapherotrites archaeon]
MSRLIAQNEQGPLELKPSAESRWLCRCGLSKNQVFCDGSHKKTLDEDPSKTYEYAEDGSRKEII